MSIQYLSTTVHILNYNPDKSNVITAVLIDVTLLDVQVLVRGVESFCCQGLYKYSSQELYKYSSQGLYKYSSQFQFYQILYYSSSLTLKIEPFITCININIYVHITKLQVEINIDYLLNLLTRSGLGLGLL